MNNGSDLVIVLDEYIGVLEMVRKRLVSRD